jgi:hypothetical protein
MTENSLSPQQIRDAVVKMFENVKRWSPECIINDVAPALQVDSAQVRAAINQLVHLGTLRRDDSGAIWQPNN